MCQCGEVYIITCSKGYFCQRHKFANISSRIESKEFVELKKEENTVRSIGNVIFVNSTTVKPNLRTKYHGNKNIDV